MMRMHGIHLVGGGEVDPDVDAPLHALAGGHLRVHDAAPRRQPLHAHTYGTAASQLSIDTMTDQWHKQIRHIPPHACIYVNSVTMH